MQLLICHINMNNYISVRNNQVVPLESIPVLRYEELLQLNVGFLKNPDCHCINYFAQVKGDDLNLFCCVAHDKTGKIYVSSSLVRDFTQKSLPSFTAQHFSFHIFEREIHENTGLKYDDHPWLKPIRYPHNRADKDSTLTNYPFYQIPSEQLHEVGVGPIHAGIIEPGHFRFICNGEQILHLEIQLGYQHRGIEDLFFKEKANASTKYSCRINCWRHAGRSYYCFL